MQKVKKTLRMPTEGLFTSGQGWGMGGEEDPSTKKILEGGTSFRWVYKQKCRSVWLPRGGGIKECKPQ